MTDNVIDDSSATLDTEVLDLASRLFDAARSGDAAMLAAYLDAGVPVNLTNTNGDTLVMLAAYYGHESAVAALIARGADVNRHNNRGQTPLAGAVFKNDTTIIELLLSPMPIRRQARRPHLRPRGSSKGTNSRGNCCNTSSGGAARTSSRNAHTWHRADHFAMWIAIARFGLKSRGESGPALHGCPAKILGGGIRQAPNDFERKEMLCAASKMPATGGHTRPDSARRTTGGGATATPWIHRSDATCGTRAM